MIRLFTTFILFSVSCQVFAQSVIEGTNPTTEGNAYAIKGTITSSNPGGFSAGVRGQNNGTGVLGVGVYGSQNGSGYGVYGTAIGGMGVYGSSTSGYGLYGLSSSGTGIYGTSSTGQVAIFSITNSENINTVLTANTNGTGSVGVFANNNSSNSSNVIGITSTGLGHGLNIQLNNASNGARGINVEQSGVGPGVYASSAGGNGVWGVANVISAAGVLGDNNAAGESVVGRTTSSDPNKDGTGVGAVVGRNDLMNGYGVRGFVTKSGAVGVLGQAGISGGINMAARFENVYASNTTDVVLIQSNSTSNLLVLKKSGSNVARINSTGTGYFNGGTVSSGADVAEAFEVEGSSVNYEPGDVMIISTQNDRTLAKSDGAYSNLVVGVYATKPGVLLTEENTDHLSAAHIPLGVVGVIPTKVCLEGGAIKRGDFLVTSSQPGVAMKADIEKIKVGQLIGKALQDYNSEGVGKIKVMVNVR